MPCFGLVLTHSSALCPNKQETKRSTPVSFKTHSFKRQFPERLLSHQTLKDQNRLNSRGSQVLSFWLMMLRVPPGRHTVKHPSVLIHAHLHDPKLGTINCQQHLLTRSGELQYFAQGHGVSWCQNWAVNGLRWPAFCTFIWDWGDGCFQNWFVWLILWSVYGSEQAGGTEWVWLHWLYLYNPSIAVNFFGAPLLTNRGPLQPQRQALLLMLPHT